MKNFSFILLSLFTIMLLTACNASNNNETDNDDKSTNQTDTGKIEFVLISHELGETEVQKNPEKIVVFDFGMLDTLDYLGVDVVGVPQMGVPSYLETYNSAEYENVGSLKEPDFEKIALIDPDLIIISARQAELYDELSKLGPVVYVGLDYNNYIDSFKANVEMIGEIFGKEAEVDAAISEIEMEISEIDELVQSSDKNALILLANDNKISAYGEASRFGIIHDVFGIPAVDHNIEQSTHGMNVTFEYVVEQNPDIIYVIDRSAAIGEEPSAKHIVENDLIAKTKAMQNDDIYYLDAEIWYLSGGGIVSIQEMIKDIASSLQ